jgi:hypothetical protein
MNVLHIMYRATGLMFTVTLTLLALQFYIIRRLAELNAIMKRVDEEVPEVIKDRICQELPDILMARFDRDLPS